MPVYPELLICSWNVDTINNYCDKWADDKYPPENNDLLTCLTSCNLQNQILLDEYRTDVLINSLSNENTVLIDEVELQTSIMNDQVHGLIITNTMLYYFAIGVVFAVFAYFLAKMISLIFKW